MDDKNKVLNTLTLRLLDTCTGPESLSIVSDILNSFSDLQDSRTEVRALVSELDDIKNRMIRLKLNIKEKICGRIAWPSLTSGEIVKNALKIRELNRHLTVTECHFLAKLWEKYHAFPTFDLDYL